MCGILVFTASCTVYMNSLKSDKSLHCLNVDNNHPKFHCMVEGGGGWQLQIRCVHPPTHKSENPLKTKAGNQRNQEQCVMTVFIVYFFPTDKLKKSTIGAVIMEKNLKINSFSAIRKNFKIEAKKSLNHNFLFIPPKYETHVLPLL